MASKKGAGQKLVPSIPLPASDDEVAYRFCRLISDTAATRIVDKYRDGVVVGGSKQATVAKAITSLIRSQNLIKVVHWYAAALFVKEGVPASSLLFEKKLDTPFDGKDVDLSVAPDGDWSGEKIVAVGCRSQIASIQKNLKNNFSGSRNDATDFHEQYPKQVVGHLQVLMLREIDAAELDANRLAWSPAPAIARTIKWWVTANGRPSTKGRDQGIERVGLLVVDPAPSPDGQMVYRTVADLIDGGFLTEAEARGQGIMADQQEDGVDPLVKLSTQTFAKDLLEIHAQRFNSGDEPQAD